MSEWTKIYETSKMHQALIIQSILKEHHIQSVLMNQQSSAYVLIGEIQVLVKAEDSSEAIEIIADEFS